MTRRAPRLPPWRIAEDDDAQAPADRDDRFRDLVNAGIIEQRQQKQKPEAAGQQQMAHFWAARLNSERGIGADAVYPQSARLCNGGAARRIGSWGCEFVRAA